MSRTSSDTVAALTTGHALPRVNLLPPEVHEARKLRRTQLALVSGVAVVAVLVGGLWFMQNQAASSAKTDLDATRAQGQTLLTQKSQYAEVPKTLGQITAAETARQTAMAGDVQWYRYLNDLSYITPKNAWLTQLTVSTAATAGATTNPIAHPGIATVTVTGKARHHDDVATWLDAIAKEKGFTDAYFSNSTKSVEDNKNIVTFASSATVTSDALSHRYDRKAG